MSTLYLVATPIGHLDDVSDRAKSVLRQVAAIGCEDTRTSSVLLRRHGIDTPVFAFHQHNEHGQLATLMRRLDGGEDLALITDAGMPGISDPGFLAVREVHRRGAGAHEVRVIPGPDACTTALVSSGLPADRYLFEGFLPHKKGRATRLREIAGREITTVLFESPHRLARLLEELRETAGSSRMVCVCRELTKAFEEHIRGEAGDVAEVIKARGKVKGEIVVVVAPASYREEPGQEASATSGERQTDEGGGKRDGR